MKQIKNQTDNRFEGYVTTGNLLPPGVPFATPVHPSKYSDEYYGMAINSDTIIQLASTHDIHVNISLGSLFELTSKRMPWVLLWRRDIMRQLIDEYYSDIANKWIPAVNQRRRRSNGPSRTNLAVAPEVFPVGAAAQLHFGSVPILYPVGATATKSLPGEEPPLEFPSTSPEGVADVADMFAKKIPLVLAPKQMMATMCYNFVQDSVQLSAPDEFPNPGSERQQKWEETINIPITTTPQPSDYRDKP